MSGEIVISTVNLTRKFDKTVAVDKVNINVKKGAIYGLIGRNGAGKTTILKMVAGLIRPSSGKIEIFGAKGKEILTEHKLRKVGTLIEAPGLQNSMTAEDNLKLKCICMGYKDYDSYIASLLETVGLTEAAKKKAGAFSLGMRQRLGIALALVGDPEVLILDEPINGLDPQGIADVREMIVKLNREKGITILISSHILEELSKIVTDYGIIEKGKMVCEFSREYLENACADRVIIQTDTPETAADALKSMGITDYTAEENIISIPGRKDETPDIIKGLVDGGARIRTVHIGGKTLEEFFLDTVGGGRND